MRFAASTPYKVFSVQTASPLFCEASQVTCCLIKSITKVCAKFTMIDDKVLFILRSMLSCSRLCSPGKSIDVTVAHRYPNLHHKFGHS